MKTIMDLGAIKDFHFIPLYFIVLLIFYVFHCFYDFFNFL